MRYHVAFPALPGTANPPLIVDSLDALQKGFFAHLHAGRDAHVKLSQPNDARIALRHDEEICETCTRVWASTPHGRMLSLSIEDLQDVWAHPHKKRIFPTRIVRSTDSGPLAYKLRMVTPSFLHTCTVHTSLHYFFYTIAQVWGLPLDPGPGFLRMLLRSGPDLPCFATSAYHPGSVGAVPFTLADAEQALSSHHATLAFQHRLRSEMHTASF